MSGNTGWAPADDGLKGNARDAKRAGRIATVDRAFDERNARGVNRRDFVAAALDVARR